MVYNAIVGVMCFKYINLYVSLFYENRHTFLYTYRFLKQSKNKNYMQTTITILYQNFIHICRVSLEELRQRVYKSNEMHATYKTHQNDRQSYLKLAFI